MHLMLPHYPAGMFLHVVARPDPAGAPIECADAEINRSRSRDDSGASRRVVNTSMNNEYTVTFIVMLHCTRR